MNQMVSSSAVFAVFLAVLAVGAVPGPLEAQTVFESAGERALGMAGAFVAVADDASAAHWNPAGLATGGPAGMTIGWHRFRFGNQDDAPAAGVGRRRVSFTSLGTWPVGLSYGRFTESWLVADEGGLRADSLRVSQVGVSVLQSVAPGLVVGSTVKLLRGGVASGLVGETSASAALDAAEERSADSRTTIDLDVSVMASSDLIRLGVTLKNVRSPSFGAIPGTERSLPRRARAGLAVTPGAGVTLALDVDLDTVDLTGGLRRMGAFGGEVMLGRHLGIRSGVRWSLSGPRHPMGAIGLSVAVRRGFWLDGHYANGRLHEDRELGVALRAGF